MRVLTARKRQPAYASLVSSLDRWLPTLVSIPLVGVILYLRLSRSFGRQPMVAWKMILRVVLLSLAATIVGVVLLLFPTAQRFEAAALGAFVGTVLARFGLTRTHVEVTPEGRFFTPHKWTQLVVTALFIGRLVARLTTDFGRNVTSADMVRNHQVVVSAQPAYSPLTIALFFLFALYYVVYYVSLLRRARSLPAT